MIDSQKLLESERITFICDYCQKVFDIEVNSFSEALAEAKSVGWIMRKNENDWLHFCCYDCLHNYFCNET